MFCQCQSNKSFYWHWSRADDEDGGQEQCAHLVLLLAVKIFTSSLEKVLSIWIIHKYLQASQDHLKTWRHLTPRKKGIIKAAAPQGCFSFKVFVKSSNIFAEEYPCRICYFINLFSSITLLQENIWEGNSEHMKCFKFILRYFTKLFTRTVTVQRLSWWLKLNKAPVKFYKLSVKRIMQKICLRSKYGSNHQTGLYKIIQHSYL